MREKEDELFRSGRCPRCEGLFSVCGRTINSLLCARCYEVAIRLEAQRAATHRIKAERANHKGEG